MAYTQADLETLKKAYAAGVLTVRYSDGKQVTYPSGDDLRQRIREVETELAAQQPSTKRPVAGFTSFRRS